MDIIWKEIEYGNGRFSISNTGKVRNNLTGNVYATQIQNSGYEIVHLNFNGKRKAFTVHRLVTIAFIPKISGSDNVDHIDNCKLNNHFSNLRWVTGKENMQYAVKNGCLKEAGKKAAIRMKTLGSVYGFDNSQKYLKEAMPIELFINGQFVKFRSGRQASMHLKIDHKTLTARVKRGLYKPLPSTDLQLQF